LKEMITRKEIETQKKEGKKEMGKMMNTDRPSICPYAGGLLATQTGNKRGVGKGGGEIWVRCGLSDNY